MAHPVLPWGAASEPSPQHVPGTGSREEEEDSSRGSGVGRGREQRSPFPL